MVVVPLVLVVQVLEPLGMVIIKVEFGISQPDQQGLCFSSEIDPITNIQINFSFQNSNL